MGRREEAGKLSEVGCPSSGALVQEVMWLSEFLDHVRAMEALEMWGKDQHRERVLLQLLDV